jgi:hypothetical protein
MMRKLVSIIAVLSLALIGPAFAAVQNIKVSGDITTTAFSRYGFDFGGTTGLVSSATSVEDDLTGLLSIIRLRVDADLTENVGASVRLLNERVWGTLNETSTSTDIDLDLAYVEMRDILEYPITMRIGRQPIMLGDGAVAWLPYTNGSGANYSGTTITANGGSALPSVLNDLSAREGFDAITAVVDLSPTTILLGWAKITEGNAAISNADLAEDDDLDAYIVEVTHDFDNNLIAQLFYALKNAKKSTGHTGGLRSVFSPMDALTLKAEGYLQWAKGESGMRADGKTRNDLALVASATYDFLDVDWNPSLGLDFGHFSRNWDALFEGLTPARIANAMFPNSNLQWIGVEGAAQPMEDVSVKLRYAYFEQDEKGASLTTPFASSYSVDTTKDELGSEVDLTVMYDYTEDVQVGLNFDWFGPGDYFSSTNDDDAFQTLLTLGVTF